MSAFAPDVDSAITNAAASTGMDPNTLRAIAGIESSGNPGARTGSYQGLFQLSPTEFSQYSPDGSIYDAADNALAGAQKLKAESSAFASQYGRQPTAGELYLIHQQGAGGAAAHWAHPDAPAWQNMASTGEGRQKGENWAKRAIWGNIPDDMKARFGSVENVTSKDFVNLWNQKVSGSQYVSRDQLPKPTADATQPSNTLGPNGGINYQPGLSPELATALNGPAPASSAVAPSPTPQTADNSSTGKAPAGVLGQLLGMIAGTQNAAPDATSGQQTQMPSFGSLIASTTQDNANAANPNNLVRLQSANTAATAAKNADMGFDPVLRRPIDLSRLQAAIAARRGIA